MFVLLILLILFIQFAIGYLALRYLTSANASIVKLNGNVVALNSTLRTDFVNVRNVFKSLNEKIEFIMEQEEKFIIIRKLFWIKALIASFLIIKKRKKFIKVFSVMSAMNTLVQGILEL